MVKLKLLLWIMFLVLHSNADNSQQNNATVKLSVYYETLCPDSKRFITSQLEPLMASSLGQHVNLVLVPYGKARTTRTLTNVEFSCQHGSAECNGNEMHSCALKLLPGEQSMQFVFCTMKKYRPATGGQSCCEKLKLNFTNIESCTHGPEGKNYLAENGDETHALKPKLYFVPWIVFNDIWAKNKMNDALKNLREVVCQELGGKICT